MSFRFARGEPVERGIKRMVREQIDKAVTEIDTRNLSHHERVHQVRKRCKKVRALARLARPALGDRYSDVNRRFRDLARPLSDVRDAAALVESFDDVADGEEGAAARFAAVREALVARRDAVAGATDVGALLDDARSALLAGRDDVDTWHVHGDGFGAVDGGVKRVYRRGRKAMRRARKEPSAANHHEWRKRAKYLWHHLRVLRPLWPAVVAAVRDEADDLADVLGDDHDIHVFRTAARDDAALARVAELPAYLELLDRRSRALRERADRIAGRLYAEKPKRFVKRLERYAEVAGTPA